MIRRRLLAGLLTAVVLTGAFGTALAQGVRAQSAPSERTFHEPKSAVEKALKELQPAMSGRLPALEASHCLASIRWTVISGRTINLPCRWILLRRANRWCE